MEWTAPLHGIVQRARFVRGFVERVTLLPEGFIQRGEELFRLAPVRHVIITDPGQQVAAIAKCSWLASVETLEFRTLARATIAALVPSEHLSQLTGLILRFSGLDDFEAMFFAETAPETQLTTLDLYGCAFGWESVAALVRSQYLTGVKTLVLNDNDELDENVANTFSGPDVRMTGLTTLRLGFTSLGDVGARRLGASPHLQSLHTLDVNNCGLGPEGAQALLESPNLQGLALLDLSGNALSASVRKRLRARLGDRVKV
jgi:hypothetical protein